MVNKRKRWWHHSGDIIRDGLPIWLSIPFCLVMLCLIVPSLIETFRLIKEITLGH